MNLIGSRATDGSGVQKDLLAGHACPPCANAIQEDSLKSKLFDGFAASFNTQLTLIGYRAPEPIAATATLLLAAPVALKPGGWFLFTVENGGDHQAGYKIQFYGRYAQRTGNMRDADQHARLSG